MGTLRGLIGIDPPPLYTYISLIIGGVACTCVNASIQKHARQMRRKNFIRLKDLSGIFRLVFGYLLIFLIFVDTFFI